MNSKTKKMTTLAVLCAISYVVMVIGRIPIVLFLKYDPKDVIITLGGLIWGPMSACIVSVIVSFIKMFTVSETTPLYMGYPREAVAGLLLPAFYSFCL